MSTFMVSDNTTLQACQNNFGPTASGCRNDFDFTLLFEQSLLSIGPSALFLLLMPIRTLQLSKESYKVRRSPLHSLKLATSTIYLALQVTLLVLWAQPTIQKTQVSIATAILGLLSAIALCLLSHIEHSKSVRPSTIISVYLLFSSIFDAVQCRTLWLTENEHVLATVFTTSLGIKLMMFCLEIKGKRNMLLVAWKHLGVESTSGVLSRAIFWWINDLMILGFKTMLSIDSMYTTDRELGSERLEVGLKKVWERKEKKGRYELLFCLIQSLKFPILLGVFPRICLSGFKFAQPFLIHRVINYVSAEDHLETKNSGYGLIGATAIIYIGISISTAFYQHMVYRAITMIRGALSSLIYSRIFQLNSLTSTTQGSATLTLTSTDVERICSSFEGLHELWANPIEVAVAVWLLQQHLGVACIAPAFVVICCTGAAARLSKYMGPARKIWNDSVQKRVSTTSNIVGSIKEVKLLGWISTWLEQLQILRIDELNMSKKFRVLIVYANLIGNTPSMLAPVLTFGVFILVAKFQTHQTLTIATAFTSLSIMSLLMGPLASLLAAIPNFAGSLGCFDRIQTFLLAGDYQDHQQPLLSSDTPVSSAAELSDGVVELSQFSTSLPEGLIQRNKEIFLLKKCSFSLKPGDAPILKDIDVQINHSTFTVVIGKVGSGKSMLLKALLGELYCSSGSFYVCNKNGIAYCDQQTWLINSTIKQNIVCHSSLDEEWYKTVVNACALDEDIQGLPNSDKALVGSKGLSLSEGQKQRVALARALYSRKEFLVIDDVLSGLDWKTRDLVWSRVFGPNGLLRSQGSSVLLATHSLRHLTDADNIIILEKGRVIEQRSSDRLEHTNGHIQSLLAEDAAIALANNVEAQSSPILLDRNTPEDSDVPQISKNNQTLKRSGETALYQYYFQSIGWVYGILGLGLSALSTFFIFFPQIWLMYWSQADTSHPGAQSGMYYSLYAMFGIVGLLCTGLNIWFMFVIVVPKSAQNLHWILLKTVMSAPLSFFVSTDTGTVINRFSQDMSLIDMQLPSALFTTLSGAFSCLASAVIILIGAKYLSIVLPFALIALYILQLFYLRTSRQIRHLDIEAKSPLYSHILETVNGLTSIRAFGWQSRFCDKNTQLLDISQRPFYLMYCIQRWLNLVLDLFIAALAVLLITMAIQMKETTSAGAIGLAMVNVLGFNENLSEFILSWTSLETSLGAIARLRTFEAETPSEPIISQPREIPESWPSHGSIEFNDITALYSASTKPALNGLTLSIKAGEKVAICGRTGSGKSSLLLTLFRLLDLNNGEIRIDNINISHISQNTLRERFNIIPQEAVLFPGSLRFNILPPKLPESRRPEDDIIIGVLEQVDLWSVVSTYGGLDADISDIPLSQGQKQLFCLARAILRKDLGRVLVLDEAMSSVDQHTEELMTRTIRDVFHQHTVLAVAHQLNTVVDFDKIVVIEDGKVVEVGRPEDLMRKEEGKFRELWNKGM